MDDIVERLRGEYRIAITDGLGATAGGEEPDNPKEFVRRFPVPPIQIKAADEIERLREALRWYSEHFCELGRNSELCGRMDDDNCAGCKAREALEGRKDG